MKFGTLADNYDVLPFPMILLDKNFKIVDWNNSAVNVFKFSKDEAIGSYVLDLIVPERVKELQEFKSTIKNIAHGDYTELINENITKDGVKLICHWYNKIMYDSSNEKFTLSIAKDITMENVYHRQKVIYESLISQTPSMISIYKDFKPIYVNGSFREFSDRLLLEYNDDLRNLLINLNSEEHFDDIKNLSNNDSLAFDVQLKHGNKKYYLHVICFEILFGNDVHHAIVMNDFTKINKMNESVEQSKKTFD